MFAPLKWLSAYTLGMGTVVYHPRWYRVLIPLCPLSGSLLQALCSMKRDAFVLRPPHMNSALINKSYVLLWTIRGRFIPFAIDKIVQGPVLGAIALHHVQIHVWSRGKRRRQVMVRIKDIAENLWVDEFDALVFQRLRVNHFSIIELDLLCLHAAFPARRYRDAVLYKMPPVTFGVRRKMSRRYRVADSKFVSHMPSICRGLIVN